MTNYAVVLAIAAALTAAPIYAAASGEVTIENPELVDATGTPITDRINVNQKFYIATNISSESADDQNFVYIVQVADEDGTIVLLEWFSGEIAREQRLNIAVSWVPSSPGTYTAEVFLWDSLHDQNALDSNKAVTISIS